MTYNEIIDKYNAILSLLFNKKIVDAINELKDLAKESGIGIYLDQIQQQESTYKSILSYSFAGVEDPEKASVYNRLVVALIEIADKTKESLITKVAPTKFYLYKKELEQAGGKKKEEIINQADKLIFGEDINELFNSGQVQKENQQTKVSRESLVQDVFRLIWLSDKLNDDDIQFIRNIFSSDSIYWYEKCVFVSALTISLQRFFDVSKINVLFDLYNESPGEIWQRALIGLILTLFQYDKRIDYYPELANRLKSYGGDDRLEKHVEIALTQLIRSKETEKITKKLRDEIIPEMEKIRPKLNEKLGLDKIVSETDMEGKNPDWQTFFEDTPDLMNKLEEISRMQMEGSDVFMSAFSMLKQFPFFNEISNWFMPFYEGNNIAAETIGKDDQMSFTGNMIESLARSAFMCNSDKYSFCYNVQMIPQQQKQQMSELFKQEIEGMSEISKDEELINQNAKTKTIITQYLQDIYRFYKLFGQKQYFYDVFNTDLDLYNASFFKLLIQNPGVLRNIGEFYFEKDYYEDAVQVFSRLAMENENDRELLEKLAYSYQRLKKYPQAIEVYHKVELFDENRAWTLKNLALCYKRNKAEDKAIEYYKQAEAFEPDNLYIQAYLGHCYLDIMDYETALQYYFKVEYLAPSNSRIMRPIAWCSFILGKFETAQKYYNKLFEKGKGNMHDYLNYGHVEWCMGNPQNALEAYKNSINQKGASKDSFEKEYLGDKDYLLQHGINEIDIYLMLDQIKMV